MSSLSGYQDVWGSLEEKINAALELAPVNGRVLEPLPGILGVHDRHEIEHKLDQMEANGHIQRTGEVYIRAQEQPIIRVRANGEITPY